MRRALVVIALATLVVAALAAPASDVKVTTDTAVTVTGRTVADVWCNGGTATYKLVDGADDTLRYYYGRDGIARRLDFGGLGIVEMYIDIHDASEVIYTLE